MVKIERKNTEKTALAIESLKEEKIKSSGKCNTEEVVLALMETFYNKCYICEDDKFSELQVEHLIPHGGDINLKFDWNNLFLACGRCNHIKGDKYTPILDCTKVEVDEIVSFRKIGYFGIKELFVFEKVDTFTDDEKIQMTCDLLTRVYYGKTPQEQVAAKMLRHKVQSELSKFKNCIRDYLESTGEVRKDLFDTICKQLRSSSPFAAFKRWIVRDNSNCKDFLDCWKE